MTDDRIHGRIEELVSEEHELWEREAAGSATDDDKRRLDELKVSLDQCWDLLRQRRAFARRGSTPTRLARATPTSSRATSSSRASSHRDLRPDHDGRRPPDGRRPRAVLDYYRGAIGLDVLEPTTVGPRSAWAGGSYSCSSSSPGPGRRTATPASTTSPCCCPSASTSRAGSRTPAATACRWSACPTTS